MSLLPRDTLFSRSPAQNQGARARVHMGLAHMGPGPYGGYEGPRGLDTRDLGIWIRGPRDLDFGVRVGRGGRGYPSMQKSKKVGGVRSSYGRESGDREGSRCGKIMPSRAGITAARWHLPKWLSNTLLRGTFSKITLPTY